MLNYSAIHVFSTEALRALKAATQLVELVPDSFKDVRCHELTRAVAFVLDRVCNVSAPRMIDGTYMRVYEHSWIELRELPRRVILDVYAIGALPQVQLVDGDMRNSPYQIGAEHRTDIDTTMVAELVAGMKVYR